MQNLTYLSREITGEVTQADRYCLSAGKSLAGVPPPHLSRRDRNRADLSSDK